MRDKEIKADHDWLAEAIDIYRDPTLKEGHKEAFQTITTMGALRYNLRFRPRDPRRVGRVERRLFVDQVANRMGTSRVDFSD